MKPSDINHLRRLLGYVRCEIGPTPEERAKIVGTLAPHLGEISDDGKLRLIQAQEKSQAVPKYIRAAVKALEKLCQDEGLIVDGDRVVDDISVPRLETTGATSPTKETVAG